MEYNALFVGLTTVDIQYFVEEFPQANRKVKTKPPDILVGGPSANAAIAFSHLNNGANLITAVGENSFTSFIKNDFQSHGICAIDLIHNQSINPVLASVITAKNGERNIFTHNPADVDYTTDIIELFTDVNPEILLLDGFYPKFSLACAKYAKSVGIPVVIDCGSWKPQYTNLLQFSDIAICSADFRPPGCVDNKQVFNFVNSLGVKHIGISQGHKNILVKSGNVEKEIRISEELVADTLGAGDFLHGAFCYYYLKHDSFTIALQRASELATFSCKYKGTREWLKFWK